MSLKAIAARIYASLEARRTARWKRRPLATQEAVFKELLRSASNTTFGKDHQFSSINTHEDFCARVPIRDYEDLKPYINRVLQGEEDILWPGKPIYFAKTSGTTSGLKYIPISAISMKEQVAASRNAILNYIHETGKSAFVDG